VNLFLSAADNVACLRNATVNLSTSFAVRISSNILNFNRVLDFDLPQFNFVSIQDVIQELVIMPESEMTEREP
jgi:hypothetical protein